MPIWHYGVQTLSFKVASFFYNPVSNILACCLVLSVNLISTRIYADNILSHYEITGSKIKCTSTEYTLFPVKSLISILFVKFSLEYRY